MVRAPEKLFQTSSSNKVELRKIFITLSSITICVDAKNYVGCYSGIFFFYLKKAAGHVISAYSNKKFTHDYKDISSHTKTKSWQM